MLQTADLLIALSIKDLTAYIESCLFDPAYAQAWHIFFAQTWLTNVAGTMNFDDFAIWISAAAH